MNPYQEPKYEIKDGKLVNRQSGQLIPEDEPVFILRARDVHAAQTIAYYGKLLQEGKHRDAVASRVAQFHNWAILHRDRMKEPDIDLTNA